MSDPEAPTGVGDPSTRESDAPLTEAGLQDDPDPMGRVADTLGRFIGRRPRRGVEPHAFVASMTMIPTTPSKGGPIAEPLTVSAILCNRSDCGRPRQDPVHHIAED